MLDDGSRHLPQVGFHLHEILIGKFDENDQFAVVPEVIGHLGDRAVDPAIAGIVGEHHDLRAALEDQFFVHGDLETVQIAGEECGVMDRFLLELLEHPAVACGGHAVGGGQRQPEFLDGRREFGVRAGVELSAGLLEQAALTHGIENVDQAVVTDLPEHRAQLDRGEILRVVGVRGEEIRGLVAGGEVFTFVVGDHGRQLIEVPDQHQLHPAVFSTGLGAKPFQRGHQAVEEIGTDHGGLIHDQGVQFPQCLGEPAGEVLTGAHLLRGHPRIQRQQPVDRVALHVERGDSGRCHDHHIPTGVGHELADQRGLTGARLAREEHVFAVMQPLQGVLEFASDDQLRGVNGMHGDHSLKPVGIVGGHAADTALIVNKTLRC